MSGNLADRLRERLPPDHVAIIRETGKLAHEMGLKPYLVGGAVRDLLLGQTTFDIDLAKLSLGKLSLDLAMARSEKYPRPGALPVVQPGSIGDDLGRRDFTINAMAVNVGPEDFGELVDPHRGEKDLTGKVVRVLHEKSFVDDATRMLRAIRYEQRFRFRLERATEKLLRDDVSMLNTVGGDRIRHELELILREEKPEECLQRAGELGVLGAIDPSLGEDGSVAARFRQARRVAPNSQPSPALYFSVLFYRFSLQHGDDLISLLKLPGTTAKVVRDTLRLKEQL
ncbi:MAG: hypothetical protein NTU41_11890, partial [Chloroflexi bacterium]|nr:hypothetical protein [Chloroflexota bacterium]